MYLHRLKLFILLTVLPFISLAQLTPRSKQIIADAQKVVKAYHAGAPKANNVVKVVYFHGRDRETLANWEARLDRVLTAVDSFYRDEFKKAGVDGGGVNFERTGKNMSSPLSVATTILKVTTQTRARNFRPRL
ncbi:hypothetical protein [Mucilaginibacter antarcticus]|uniref:hypothetical protein n=1 Tax=Mucilaginibacter antarcticus TaxID=1855725 RepID=UPI0036424FE8